MKISLKSAGKKYYREWIFRRVDLDFPTGQKSVILGPNGSGKSTLLQVIAGAILPNEGIIEYNHGTVKVSADEIYNYVSFASPYLELIEEFTLMEIIRFHFKFKIPVNQFSEQQVLEATGLVEKSDTIFKYFSSGMKQRVKLALAILSDTPLLLLDEPCSNLDSKGIDWYNGMIKSYSDKRTVIVASNHNEYEYFFCDKRIEMTDLKK